MIFVVVFTGLVCIIKFDSIDTFSIFGNVMALLFVTDMVFEENIPLTIPEIEIVLL